MNRGRRSVAGVAAGAVIAAAVVLGMVHLILGMAADRQEMSLAGISPTTMSVSAWSAGGLLAAFLLLCGGLLVRTAVTDRPPGRRVRAVLTGCAALHAVLATVAVGIAGWLVFAALIGVFGLVVLTLMMYPAERAAAESGAGAPETGGAGPAALRPTTR